MYYCAKHWTRFPTLERFCTVSFKTAFCKGFIVFVCFFSLLLKPAITAVEVATLPRTARSPRESESSAATTVANQAIWLVTVTMRMSRSAILVENLDIFKKIAPK